MRTKSSVFVVIILAVVAAFAGWVIGKDISRERVKEPVTTATGTPLVVIEPVPATHSELPDLNRPIKISTNLSREAKANATKRIQELTTELRKDKGLFQSWLDLALQRKLIGDYVAAEEIWIYITQNWADDPIAYNNLADFYLMTLHDNKRAEIYLLRTIEKEPIQVIWYENAYSFYRFVKKDLPRARQILEQGIAKNPSNAQGLKKLLADLEAAS